MIQLNSSILLAETPEPELCIRRKEIHRERERKKMRCNWASHSIKREEERIKMANEVNRVVSERELAF